MARMGGGGGGTLLEILEDTEALRYEMAHDTLIFPVDTDETMVFVGATVADTWITWTQIADNNASTFASALVADDGHITAYSMETANQNDAIFHIELAYGLATGATPITSIRIFVGTAPIEDVAQLIRVRSAIIPAGSGVWYRAKCSVAGSKTITGHLRYHLAG